MARKQKIVRILARLTGGPAKHVTWLGMGMEDKGYHTLLLCGRIKVGEDMGFFYDQTGLKRVFLRFMQREVSIWRDILSILEIFWVVWRFKPDLVHTHTSKAGFNGRVAMFLVNLLCKLIRKKKIPVIHTYHGHTFHGYFAPWKEKLFLFLEQLLARYATDKIIVLSSLLHREIYEKYKVGIADQYQVVPLGIEMEFAKKLDNQSYRLKYGFGGDCLIFGTVGRITGIKNYELFLEAIDSLQKKGQCGKCEFVLVGDGEKDYVRYLRSLAEGKNLKQVSFLGLQHELDKVYGLIDVLVLTSDNEGTPVVILESFAAKVPVIASLVGGVVDLLGGVIEKKNGFTLHERGIGFKPKDLSGLVAAVEWIQNSNAGDFVERAHSYVLANHSLDNLINNIDDTYQSLC